eukprot:1641531-Rhodomonas_salina.1
MQLGQEGWCQRRSEGARGVRAGSYIEWNGLGAVGGEVGFLLVHMLLVGDCRRALGCCMFIQTLLTQMKGKHSTSRRPLQKFQGYSLEQLASS